MHDPYLDDYINAGLSYENGNYTSSMREFYDLVIVDYLNSKELYNKSKFRSLLNEINQGKLSAFTSVQAMERAGEISAYDYSEALESAYQEAVKLYESGYEKTAYKVFSELGKYKDSESYVT